MTGSRPGPAARIRPGGRREVGLRIWVFSQIAGRVAGTRAPALFLTLGRNRPLFRGWLRFAARLMPRGTLPRRDTELIILRVAHLCGCAYEFTHHERLGRRVRRRAERRTTGDRRPGRERLVRAGAGAPCRRRPAARGP
ncbi:carboxymuconolactone decarboxylase family protein [Streptomyces sp. LHD-70]|uniref:carboxymuconolactone decarboxylase family protein n=1 Tax=Streptomyces sp. LHD-70 TaxID=3072140 RepID=UPI00280FC6B8|nr:carboxymuconolactone decarboxylase family protein [Streptomyces sp. LHD-70]MDQ8705268.1 carboxymuconolactone decarboxylase family protein [Streptomyces sp. LHD-70]